MKRSHVIILLLIAVAFSVYSCKSKETISAMLDNEHGLYESAINNANLALEKNPDDAEAHFQLGVSYSYIGKMAEAYREFMAAARLNPKKLEDCENNIKHNWAVHFNSGITEYQSENWEGALKEFELTAQADPRQIKGWLYLTDVLYILNRDDSTGAAYREQAFAAGDSLLARAEKGLEEYGEAMTLGGKIMVLRGENERAYQIFQELIAEDPSYFEKAEEIGDVYANKNDWVNAAKLYELAADGRMQTNNQSFDLYYNLGVSYYKMENYVMSADAYQRALTLEPDNRNANYSIFLTYFKAGMYDEAVVVGQKYTEQIAPDDASGWQILARCYGEKGMNIKSEEAIQKYMELSQ